MALTLSDNKLLTSEDEMLQAPLMVTWLLRSMNDLSTSKEAMCLSSGDRDRDFSIASHGHTFIIPPSKPDQISPELKPYKVKTWQHLNKFQIKGRVESIRLLYFMSKEYAISTRQASL